MSIIETMKASTFAVNVCFRHAITVLVPSNAQGGVGGEGGGGGGGGVSPLEVYERVGKSVIAFWERI